MSDCHDVRVSPAGGARILVVDDDPRLAASVRRALVYEGYTVDIAPDGSAALAATRDGLPDLVVLDVMLPGLDGLEVCRRLRAASDVPILMLTAREAIDQRVDGLDSGADDYLVKPFAYEELLARVRSLLRRRAPGAERLTLTDLVLEPAAREARRGDRRLDLSALEFDMLEHFLRHPRVVLTRDRILENVWGFEAESVSNVVDVYVGYLRRELESSGERRLLHTVRGVGYVLREP
jgi:two-component system response regulator MprA